MPTRPALAFAPWALLLLLFAAFAASAALAAPAGPALSANARRGAEVARAAQCNRCHDFGAALAPAKRALHCVDCHTWILGTRGHADQIARQRRDFPDWDRYLESVVHFTRLPRLSTLARRVRPSFLRRYLDAPFDLRPHLEESMIPTRLTSEDKDALVAWLVEQNGPAAAGEAPPPPALPPAEAAARAAAGRAVFVAKGCPTCHVFGNVRFQPGFDAAFYKAVGETALLAPNLRFARERLPRAVLVRFVQDPQSVDPSVTMPKFGVTPAEAEALADFLFYGDPELSPGGTSTDVGAAVRNLGRPVPFDEIYDEILGKICIHCHMNPKTNAGEGGAGNTGGLTYAGKRLNLEQYEGIRLGILRDGKRLSVLEPGPGGAPPLLLEVLLRRHREAARDQRPAFADRADVSTSARAADAQAPGMPLGLPALSVEKLSLLKTWLDQGAPGPTE